MPAGISLSIATLCNLASPVVTGILFEILTGGQPFSRYPKFLAVLGTLYIVEPLLTRVYIQNACAAGEKASQRLHYVSVAKQFAMACTAVLYGHQIFHVAALQICMLCQVASPPLKLGCSW